MVDERTRYFRRLRRLRRSARRWSVLGVGLGGAAAVLTPYAGIGLPDAVWAAAAGALGRAGLLALGATSASCAAQPAPPPPDPAAGPAARMVPPSSGAGRAHRDRRDAPPARPVGAPRPRGRLGLGPARPRLADPARPRRPAHRPRRRRDAGGRRRRAVAARPRQPGGQRRAGDPLAPADARAGARRGPPRAGRPARRGRDGAYERLVAAAAGYVAEDGRTGTRAPAVSPADRGQPTCCATSSIGLAELRRPAAGPLHGSGAPGALAGIAGTSR